MKKYALFFVLLQLLFSCSQKNDEQKLVSDKLNKWDNLIYQQPLVIRDSLRNTSTTGFSAPNIAYYSLLSTIANERATGIASDDSLISISLDWYKEGTDYYNLCRSYLYKGIVLFAKNRTDSASYFPINEAEKLYVNHSIEDKYVGALIYCYLGKISRSRQNATLAESYLKKSIEYATDAGSIRDVQFAKIELFWVYFSKKMYSEALSNIIWYGDVDTLDQDIAYSVYNALYSYYQVKKDFVISMEYVKKMLQIKENDNIIINYPRLYYSLALNFKRIGNQDSVLYYTKKTVNSIRDSSSRENHYYLRYMADLYSSKGDYKNAYDYQKKAYQSYMSVFSKLSRAKYQELEKRYDLSRKEDQISKYEVNNAILFNVAISLVLCIILLGFVLRLIIKKYRDKVEKAEIQLLSIDTDIKRAWLINEVQKVSTGLLPILLEEVSKEATRSRKVSKEVFDNLNNSVENIRNQSRNRITTIAKNETFGTLNPDLDYLTELSDFEKIILVLIDYNYSVQEIAELLNTSPSSIRSIKTKIKEKILASDDLPFDPIATFSIFK